eukprot:2596970-Prymnesium_polylepis.2
MPCLKFAHGHVQVSLYIFESTLGLHVLFDKITDPDMKVFIFQRAKAVKYQEGEMMLLRGSRGRELLMLVEGEAHMMDPYYSAVVAKVRPRQLEIMSWNPPGSVAAVKDGLGVLGGAVLTGTRHSNNVIAGTDCETYILERAELKELFEQFPKTAQFLSLIHISEPTRRS